MTAETKHDVAFWSPSILVAVFFLLHWDTPIIERLILAAVAGGLAQCMMMIGFIFTGHIAAKLLHDDSAEIVSKGSETYMVGAVMLSIVVYIWMQSARSTQIKHIAECVNAVVAEGNSPKDAVLKCNQQGQETSDSDNSFN